MTDAIRISMWSGPRNISTTMMRAFGNRADTIVVDEPFYACYLRASGTDHPHREETLAALPTDWREARAALAAPLPPARSIRFAKHIAYHYPDAEPLDWLGTERSFILIRDPGRMIASFAKKFDDIAPIVDSYRVCRRVFDHCIDLGLPCPVVDAADILADPRRLLAALCAALSIPYTELMLSWPVGSRASDGPWAPHWYDAVNASTGFRKAQETPLELDAALRPLAALAEPDYRFFREKRIR
ncbi:MAG: HAD family hydrolase [Parvularculaceae bacterium]